MELAFVSRELRDLCLNEHLARKAFGDHVTDKLKARLADLAALPFASDLFGLAGNPREEDGSGQIKIDLAEEHVLILESGHIKKRVLSTGATDWSRTRRVKILAVEMEHD